jgi:hypothetical protein
MKWIGHDNYMPKIVQLLVRRVGTLTPDYGRMLSQIFIIKRLL